MVLAVHCRIYGAPRSQLYRPVANQELCIDGYCVIIDVQEIYSLAESDDIPVLLYENGSLDQYFPHHFVLRMIETPSGRGHPEKVMTLYSVVYTFQAANKRVHTNLTQYRCLTELLTDLCIPYQLVLGSRMSQSMH